MAKNAATAVPINTGEEEIASDNGCFEAGGIVQAIASLFHFGRGVQKNIHDDFVDESATASKVDETIASSKDESINGRFDPEETRVLLRLYQMLGQRNINGEDATEAEVQAPTETETSGSSSFLMRLATCATQVAQETLIKKAEIVEEGDEHDYIQRLLKKGKRDAEIIERNKMFLHQVQHVEQHVLPERFEHELRNSIWEKADSEQRFLDVMSRWLGQRGDVALLDIVFDAVRQDDKSNSVTHESGQDSKIPLRDKDESIDAASASELVKWFYCLAIAVSMLQRCLEEKDVETKDDSISTVQSLQTPNALTSSLLESTHELEDKHNHLAAGKVSRNAFKAWHQSCFPAMSLSLALFMRQLVFSLLQVGAESRFNSSGAKTHLFPVLDQGSNQESEFLNSPISPFVYTLTCMSNENFGRKWHCLYSTSSDGLSINRLVHSIKGYDGATLFLLRAFVDNESGTTATFGAYASSPWKKEGSAEFFGSAECFLFQMYPRIKVMRTSSNPRGGRYQYFHINNTTVNSKTAKGIGFGGSASQPRLFIPTSLDKCYAGSTDTSFEPGELVPCNHGKKWFELDCLEIWGLGDDHAMGARTNHRKLRDAHLQKARQVDKAAFLTDFRTGLIESKMFDFREQMRDRDGCCLLDCDPDDSDWQIGPR